MILTEVELRLKLNSALGTVLLVVLWLGGMGTVIALTLGTHQPLWTSIYTAVGFMVISTLAKRRKRDQELPRSATKTVKEVVLLLLVVAVWLASLLVVRAKLPPQDSYTFGLVAVWATILLAIVWQLERRWTMSGDSDKHFKQRSIDRIGARNSNPEPGNRKVKRHAPRASR